MTARSIGVCAALALFALAARIDTTAAAGIGAVCGGTAGIACNAGLWCELQAGQCGAADAEGLCVHAPRGCAMAFAPVCACGGKTYPNDCQRRRAKAQRSHSGRCR